MTDGGWEESALAWIVSMGERGDKGRQFVLDPAMLARLNGRTFRHALDVGCGEGRFCRMMQERGIKTTGIDPTERFLIHARELDQDGDYFNGVAEDLPFENSSFDLVITYLTLIDIADFRKAIAEMARVLMPGGTLLAANLTGLQTARANDGWQIDNNEQPGYFIIDNYTEERVNWEEWAGIRVKNWHRPLSAYLQAYLVAGLVLKFFEEPQPVEGYPDDATRKYLRIPWFNLMEWKKPE